MSALPEPPVAQRSDGRSPYLTVGEAAALLRVTGAAITKWLREGKLRGRKLGVRRWRVERASVEEVLPDPAPAVVAPAPSAREKVLAVLREVADELTDEDCRHVAVAALNRQA